MRLLILMDCMGPEVGARREGLTESGQVMSPLDLVFLIYKRLRWPLRLPANLALIQ